MRRAPIALLLATLAACGLILPTGSGEPLVVRSGTSFGMCLGYCIGVLTLTAGEAVLEERSAQPERYPARTRRASLQPGEWEEIAALADPAVLAELREVYGCPDCADGGAEWVEVERDGRSRRVTFDFGGGPPELQPLLLRVRAVRERFR